MSTLSHINNSAQAQSEASTTTTYFVCSLLVDACQKQRLHHLAVPILGRNYKSRKTFLQQNENTMGYASQIVNSSGETKTPSDLHPKVVAF